ncbi:S-layer homology domain-containing protein [Megasphaera paucivorans]|uniref:S-layer homology domain-containing protein n=1 Tax=Megasphaera paucivorans TaxID=349095 RepID=A0A1G9S2S9_9FIRM|nr:S-layer homology domain-containing protein [Megasphaera paucivorans]SDM29724.1 S-layer homology domain-containing protein [Megasphaera paucivorans]
MKKKILASLVATMAVGATCAFAANPFVDVPTDSWAYKSVVELADAGIIQGVDGTYFQGSRNITRYEAAEMTAKAMAHMDKASVEQRAMINKLADEYADELNNLGVRVSNLEQKVGNVKMTGDFRIRYKHQSDGFTRDAARVDPITQKVTPLRTNDQFQYRMRLRANAYINDKTKAVLGISTGNKTFFDGASTAASGESTSSYVDDAYVTSDLTKNFNVKAGRWDFYNLGNGLGLQYGDTFEAMQGQYKLGNFTLTGGFGEFKEGAAYTGVYTDADGNPVSNNKYITQTGGHTLVGVQTGYGEIEGAFNKVGFGVYYNAFNDSTAKTQNLSKIIGGYAKFQLGDKWNLIGDYQKVKKDQTKQYDDDANLWGAKLSYGTAAFNKAGSWDAWLEYINADPNALYGSTNSWRQANLIDNVKSWGVGVDYTIGKNVMFSVMQSFASSLKDSSYGTKDPNEETRAQFVFVF